MPNLLKKLELNGFKSFAQKTIFEFPGGITAVVGPNGSGKSNIIDAIRWLLGERETKNLRGAKTEDLIFNGTPQRARAGQAQANLYFENRPFNSVRGKQDFFPSEFAEIVVSRQVNRAGDNKYFLNKAEVRLKDVVDFFAKSRLGTKGLVIVSQGNSDIFVRSSAEGRRMMLEEMLGLREFQIKKEEAARRLKNTGINLDKAGALVEEILPHLRSLRRQVSRFEKRGALEEELHEAENLFFGSRFQKIEEENGNLEKETAVFQKQKEILEKEKKEAAENLQKIENNQPQERQELAEIKKQKEILLEKRSRLQKELGRLETKLEFIPKKEEGFVLEAKAAGETFLKIKKLLESALEKNEGELRRIVIESLREINSILGKEKKETPVITEKKEDIKNLLEKTEKETAALEKEITAVQVKETTLEKEQENFYSSYKGAVSLLERAKDKIESWEDANREKIFAKERLKMRLEETEKQLEQSGRRREEIKLPANPVSENEADDLERKILKLRGDLASIGEIDEALGKEARETEERYQFLEKEIGDLEKAQKDLKELIKDLNEKVKVEFGLALVKINEELNKFFRLMFGGGQAKLKVSSPKRQIPQKLEEESGEEEKNKSAESETSEEKETEEENGVEIELRLPQKKINSLEMLSGGEKSLVGIAALFALISVSPPPFLVLDEVDAALDSRNSNRFAEMLKEFSKKTQFIVVTHNQSVMEAADVLYGITMGEDGTSKVVSLKLE